MSATAIPAARNPENNEVTKTRNSNSVNQNRPLDIKAKNRNKKSRRNVVDMSSSRMEHRQTFPLPRSTTASPTRVENDERILSE